MSTPLWASWKKIKTPKYKKWPLWHSRLWWNTPSKLVCLHPIAHYACWCRISHLIMVPIKFWRNSDPFKKKEHFCSSKIDWVRAYFCKSLKFLIVNQSNMDQNSLKQSIGYLGCFLSSNIATLMPFLNFPYLWVKYHPGWRKIFHFVGT